MHRVDTTGNVANAWSDGTPGVTPGTLIGEKYMNAVQEELCGFIEHFGLTLNDANNTQLLTALLVVFASLNTWTRKQTFLSTTADELGILATGNGTAEGIKAVGGSNSAAIFGLASNVGQPVVTLLHSAAGKAILAQSSSTSVDVVKVDGYVDLDGAAQPAASAGFVNRVTPKHVAKAWGGITLNHTTGAHVDNGINIFSVGIAEVGGDAHIVTVHFAESMADVNYAIAYENTLQGTVVFHPTTYSKSVDKFSFKVQMIDNTGPSAAFADFSVDDALIGFTVFAEQ